MSALVIEADSGLVLTARNESLVRPPASMVKMMLILLVAEGLEEGAWTLEQPITATRKAQRMGGTQMYLAEGETWTLDELMLAVVVGSANDAAMAVAEGLWGSEENYLRRVNERAAELGMTDSAFHSVHGLPPDRGEESDRTTARDMAILAQACVRLPAALQWTSRKTALLRSGKSPTKNTNKLLWKLPGCDGLKTGFTRAAGFCLTATAQRDGIRLISVVMGCPGGRDRIDESAKLLEDGFKRVRRLRLVEKGEVIGEPVLVANSTASEVRLCSGEELWVVVTAEDVEGLEVVAEQPDFVQAPLAAGVVLGEVLVTLRETIITRAPLVLMEDLVEPSQRWKLRRAAAPVKASD